MKRVFTIKYFFLPLFFFANNVIFPQWSTDPNNNLIVGYGQDPHICSDSAGGCYITYNHETTWYPQKLAVERLDKYGYKLWGTMRQILGELPEQWQAEIIEDSEGGVIVSYFEWYQNLHKEKWTDDEVVKKLKKKITKATKKVVETSKKYKCRPREAAFITALNRLQEQINN